MSRFGLRILAVVFAVFDSLGIFIPGAPVWFRWIGRLSAPVFLYCMAWSMDKVRDRKKYLLALYLCSLGMALLNLLFSFTTLFPWVDVAISTNLFSTMFAGGFLIWLYDYTRSHPEQKKKIWGIYAAWQLIGVCVWCVCLEIFNFPSNILQFVFTAFGNAFLAEGSGLMVLIGFLFYLTKEKPKIMRFAYYMLFFVYFVNSSTGVFGRVLSVFGSDIILVIVELMTGLSMYGTWITANFSLDHLLLHDYQWVIIAALPLLLGCIEKRGKKEKRSAGSLYLVALVYPVAAYLIWLIGNI